MFVLPTPPDPLSWRSAPEGKTAINRIVTDADKLEFASMSRHDLAYFLTTQANILRTGRDEAGTLARIGAYALAGLYARLRAEARFRRQCAAKATHAAITARKMGVN